MFYITVEFYDGEIFKYIAGTEREAKFFNTMSNSFYGIKQINIINLYDRKETPENVN